MTNLERLIQTRACVVTILRKLSLEESYTISPIINHLEWCVSNLDTIINSSIETVDKKDASNE